MDPFTAFSLATGVITFIDFSWKLMTETTEIAKSIDGRSEDTRTLDLIIKDIDASDAAIERTAAAATDTDATLSQIIQQCRAVSARLRDTLEKLAVAPGDSHWRSFTAALRAVWKKSDIESLFVTISRLRSRVLEHLNTLTL